MLVLTRKVDESIIIDDHITVTVMAIKGNHVRLGIDAPADIRVFREEIFPRDETGRPRGRGSGEG